MKTKLLCRERGQENKKRRKGKMDQRRDLSDAVENGMRMPS